LQSITGNRTSCKSTSGRAWIIVLTADGAGTTAIARAVGKGKTVVWRWQERFMVAGDINRTGVYTTPVHYCQISKIRL
jgi:hypothetical protein